MLINNMHDNGRQDMRNDGTQGTRADDNIEESKNDQAPSGSLTLPPHRYYPEDKGGKFVDVVRIPAKEFALVGVRCGCPSNTVHHNRASFRQQHIKSKTHQNWVKSLTADRPNLLSELGDLKKDIKILRVSEGLARQQVERKDKRIRELDDENLRLMMKVKQLEEEKENLNDDFTDLREQMEREIEELRVEIDRIRKDKTGLEAMTKKKARYKLRFLAEKKKISEMEEKEKARQEKLESVFRQLAKLTSYQIDDESNNDESNNDESNNDESNSNIISL